MLCCVDFAIPPVKKKYKPGAVDRVSRRDLYQARFPDKCEPTVL